MSVRVWPRIDGSQRMGCFHCFSFFPVDNEERRFDPPVSNRPTGTRAPTTPEPGRHQRPLQSQVRKMLFTQCDCDI